MKRVQLKNIVILVLVLANIYLCGILFQRYQQQSAAQDRAAQELVSLFNSQGVSLDAEHIHWDTPLHQLVLTLDENLCKTIATELLGDTATLTTLNNALSYQYRQSTLTFEPDGTFFADNLTIQDDALSFISSFCHTYGYENLVSVLDGDSGTITATATYRGILVHGVSVQFTLYQGVLTAISGTLLPQTHTTTGESATVSSLTALSRFLSTRRTTGAVISTVSDVVACYRFSSTNAMTLMPLWIIYTDNGTYLVDGISGLVQYD